MCALVSKLHEINIDVTGGLVKQIDEDILLEVVRMGFDRAQLVDSLLSRVQNKVWVSSLEGNLSSIDRT